MDTISVSESKLRAHSRPHYIARLISAPFFIAAGYLFYVLIDSLVSYILDASPVEWLEALPGMIFILLLAVAIVLPGLFIAASESIVVDSDQGVIGKRRELLGLHTPGKTINLKDIEKIICRRKSRRHTRKKPGETAGVSSSVTWYIIDLALKDGQEATLLEYKNSGEAKALAKALAKFTGISLDNRI